MTPMRDANGRFLKKGATPNLPPGTYVDANGRTRSANGRFVKGGGSSIQDIDKGMNALADWFTRNAKGGHIDIGYFTPEVALYAGANEFGTATIPSRPFMRETFDEQTPHLQRMIDTAALRAQKANIDLPDALIPAANHLRNSIITKIQSGMAPGNAPSTVARKGYDAPLTHTGQLQRALSWRTSNGKMGGGTT